MFFTVSKMLDKGEQISAMLIRYENYNIIIVNSNGYVFWNGKSVEPKEYIVKHDLTSILRLISG
jgi:hypothetical protein